MTNRKQNKPAVNRTLLYGAAGLIVLLIGAFVMINTATPCCAQDNVSAVQLISPAGYQAQFAASGTAHALIDVRTPEEFASGHIEGAVNIPVEALAGRLSEVPSGQPIVLYCRSGNRSATAARMLADAGYTAIYDLGGVQRWTAEGLPLR